MAYAVDWAVQAEEDLQRLDPLDASYVLDQVDRLAEDPGGLCSPPGFPHPEGLWKFNFWGCDGSRRIYFTVLFSWAKADDRLIIVGVGVVRY
jgi:hypothetical protein